MALFKQGEIVVDMDTGQQHRIDGGDLELDEKRYGRVEGGPLKESPTQIKQASANAAALPPAPQPEAPPMTEKQFTAARQQSAIQEPAFQSLARATIPTAAAAASFIPGLGGPIAGALLGGGSTALNQAVGMEKFDPKQIALSAAMPPAAHAGIGLVKRAFNATGAAVVPQITREAGLEAANQTMGAPARSIDRLAHLPKASSKAYEIAAQQGDVPLTEINKKVYDTWGKLTGMSNTPTRATKYLENLSNKYAGKATTTYADLTDELQLMKSNATKAFAQKDPVTGRQLMKTRAELMDEMDKISPALRKANTIYKREEATREISEALRKANPNNRVRSIFETDPLISSSFSKADTQEIYDIADKLAAMGVQGSPYSGVTAKLWNVVATPVAGLLTTPTGRFLLRQTFKNGVTPQALATAGQFGRAYMAQGGE